MNWEDIKKTVERVKSYHREIQIEKILKDTEYKTDNERFIDEIKDHLSTCINRLDYSEWFKFDIRDIPTCNCKVHIEEEYSLISFLHTLYSLYRTYDNFNIKDILQDNIITKITIKE